MSMWGRAQARPYIRRKATNAIPIASSASASAESVGAPPAAVIAAWVVLDPFPASGSLVVALTFAVFVSVPLAAAESLTVSVNVAGPAGNVARLQTTLPVPPNAG